MVSYPGSDVIQLSSSNPNVVEVDGSTTETTITLGSDEVTVGSTAFAAVASSPAGAQYTNTSTLATAISDAGLGITATPSGANQVDLTANVYGPSGNLALSTNNPYDIALSGAQMSGGSYGSLTLTFSQPMDTTTAPASSVLGDLPLSNGHTFGTGATASWNGTGTVLTVDLGSGTTVAAGDTVTVASSVTDTFGDPVAGSVTVS